MIVLVLLFSSGVFGVDISPKDSKDLPASSEDQQTLLNIIWSCLTMIFACTWLSVHSNVPGRNITAKGPISCTIEHVKIMVTAILGPEVIVKGAAEQFIVAWKKVEDLCSTFSQLTLARPRNAKGQFISATTSNILTPDLSSESSLSSSASSALPSRISTPLIPSSLVLSPVPPSISAAMSLQNITMLYRDGREGESPQDFLSMFWRVMDNRSIPADDRPAKFKYYVVAGSDAMEWYTELKKEDKEKWDKFSAAFDARWPLILAMAKTQEEKEEELTAYMLKEEDLGAKKTLGGVEMWSHDLWSREVLCLAKRAGVASGKTYIAVAWKGLPSIIRDKIGTLFTDWQDFTTKVREVPIVEITDYVEKKKRDEERQAKTEREIAELHSALARRAQESPRTALSNQLAQTNFSAPTSPSPAPRRFGRLGPGLGNAPPANKR
ncbi:hypothetical protein EDD85DRAFT_1027961 [Armillaria nabsnona]|nr:hypothetical protein EDD85DRAFT_1027961 [Armillaria nabsnona]